jgi:Leucine-rich repeat (LRR) protein
MTVSPYRQLQNLYLPSNFYWNLRNIISLKCKALLNISGNISKQSIQKN